MASINDLFNAIKDVNSNLNAIKGELQNLDTRLNAVRSTDQQGFTDTRNTLNAGFANLSQGISTSGGKTRCLGRQRRSGYARGRGLGLRSELFRRTENGVGMTGSRRPRRKRCST